MVGLLLTMSAFLPIVPGNGTPLSLDDLPAYHAALESGTKGEAVAVDFNDLWKHPETYRGRYVQVGGRVERRFRQSALGSFPPLVELWLVSGHDNPICIVFPEPKGIEPPVPGTPVRFTGTFLKLLQYASADGGRLAPLIVGGQPPVKSSTTPAAVKEPFFSALDWTIGLTVAAAVALVLAHQHLRRPPLRRPTMEPPPTFDVDGETLGNTHEPRVTPESFL